MLALRVRDVDREASVLYRDGSKEDNEGGDQIRGMLATWT